MDASALAGLNAAQHEAVRTLKGPLLVLAGAGTGKTRVITYRIANLIHHGVAPDRILAVTFTNKAAREMRERAMKLLGKRSEQTPTISTFHSLCVQILRREAELLGLPKKFAIYDRGDQETVARSALRDLRIEPARLKPGALLSFVSKWKSHGLCPQTAEKDALADDERLALLGYRRYQEMLRTMGAVDFDDLLLCTLELFEKHSQALAREQARFDFVLVDEYQDTNQSQYKILQKLCEPHRNLCVVGDDDQSIYGWRGAEVRHILAFDRDYPEAKIVRLEENYRCCPNILQLANQLIARNRERHPKTLRATRVAIDHPRFTKFEDEAAEAEGVVRDLSITALKEKLPWSAFAILFRTNEQPRAFEQELRARSIPYVLVGGFSFFDRREVRDVLAYLKTIANPSDEVSLLRILNTPPRGLGPSVVEKLLARATAAGKPIWDILPSAVEENLFASKATAALTWFVTLIQRYQDRFQGPSLVSVARDLTHEVDYKAEIARTYPIPTDQQSRWDSVGEVLNMLENYERRASAPSLAGFLEEVTLDNQDDQRQEEKRGEKVTLMTLHSAKGLEFPHVYLVGIEERLLPHERSMDSERMVAEERRLAYVGITRAKDRLTMSRALFRSRFGQRYPTEPSRFLPEMYGQDPPPPQPRAAYTHTNKPRNSAATPARGFQKSRYSRKRD